MKYFLCIVLLLVPTLFAEQSLMQETIDGKKITIIRVVLDGHHKIVTSISENGESLASLVEKAGGVSGINGAYFCPADYADCENKNSTSADRIWQGDGNTYSKYWPDTGNRGIFGFDQQGDFLFVRNNLGYSGGVAGKFNAEKIGDIWYGIGNHPILLQDGENMVPYYEKAGLIDSKMRTAGIKNMICITNDKKTVYMGNISDITLPEMPDFLENNLGCSYALNLDSGGSLGMQYEGTNIRTPGRNIMDAFVVIDTDSESDHARADRLAGEGIIQSRATLKEYELQRKVFRQEMVTMALKTVGATHPDKTIALPENYSCQNIFADLSFSRPNTWACRSIEIAAQNGLVTSKNTFFRPEDSVSRAESISMILTATGNKPSIPEGQRWETVIMQYAFEHGIIASQDLSTSIPLTRREVFEIIEKSLENARKH